MSSETTRPIGAGCHRSRRASDMSYNASGDQGGRPRNPYLMLGVTVTMTSAILLLSTMITVGSTIQALLNTLSSTGMLFFSNSRNRSHCEKMHEPVIQSRNERKQQQCREGSFASLRDFGYLELLK
jgi:hypothetical protein